MDVMIRLRRSGLRTVILHQAWLVAVMLVLVGCDRPSRNPQVDPPHAVIEWRGVEDRGIVNTYAAGPYLWGVSARGRETTAWKWSGDGVRVLVQEAAPPQAAARTVVWQDRLWNLHKDWRSDVLVIHEHGQPEHASEVQIGGGWLLTGAGFWGPSGQQLALQLVMEPKHPAFRRDQEEFMLGIYDFSDGSWRQVLLDANVPGGHWYMPRSFRPSPCGRYLAVAGYMWGVLVADMEEQRVVWTGRGANEWHTVDVVWAPDGASVFAAGASGRVYRYHARTGELLSEWWATATGDHRHAERLACMAISVDGRYVAAGTTGPNGLIFLWDAGTGRLLNAYYHGRATIGPLSFSPDSSHFLSWAGSTMKIWPVPESDDE